MTDSFYSMYHHGFIRVAVCVPHVRVADPEFNAAHTLGLAAQASDAGAAVALFPELGISSYAIDDLLQQDALLDGVTAGIAKIVEASRELSPVLLIGAPLRFEHRLFNCGIVVHRGRILGIVPKTYLPNYREFYERRQFSAAGHAVGKEVRYQGETVPFGNDLLFRAGILAAERAADQGEPSVVGAGGFTLHVEICEDVWTPVPPSSYAALAGATVLANLSASNITIGKANYRKDLCASQSGKCISAYLYSAAGPGESTTDLAWDGHALIYEDGELLAESERFADHEQVITADIDTERLAQGRMRQTSFNDAAALHRGQLEKIRTVEFTFQTPLLAKREESADLSQSIDRLHRKIERFPFVPSDAVRRDEQAYEAYNIQVHGLMQRLRATGIEKVVVGISGGLDSTQALIVASHTMDRLKLPRANILAFTMPGFATSPGTRTNAHRLMEAFGVSAHEIDIRPAAMQMFRDIGHPFAEEDPEYDITFENVQAGERTSHLFRLANYNDAPGARDRRPERTGAGLGHIRRRRPDEPLQRKRLGTEDTHSAPHPLDHRHCAVRRGREPRSCSRSWIRKFRRSSFRAMGRQTDRPNRPRLRSGLMNCRTSFSTTFPATACGRARSRSWRCRHGVTAAGVHGPNSCPIANATSTTSRR